VVRRFNPSLSFSSIMRGKGKRGSTPFRGGGGKGRGGGGRKKRQSSSFHFHAVQENEPGGGRKGKKPGVYANTYNISFPLLAPCPSLGRAREEREKGSGQRFGRISLSDGSH